MSFQTTSAAEAPPFTTARKTSESHPVTTHVETPTPEGSTNPSTFVTTFSTATPITNFSKATTPDTLIPGISTSPPGETAGPTPSTTLVASPGLSSISSSPTDNLPTSTLQSQPTVTQLPDKKIPVGEIVGGLVGGLGILVLLILVFVVYWRKRQQGRKTGSTLVPLIYEHGYTPWPSSKGTGEKAAAQRQYTQLSIEMEDRARFSDYSSATSPVVRGAGSSTAPESPVQRQVKYLSQRIVALEAQQRDLEGQLHDSHYAPPIYSPV